MRSYFAGTAALVCAASVFATDARVETMGNSVNFIKDEQTIFTNPGTIGQYDKVLMGSYGIYVSESGDSVKSVSNQQYNRDARKPYFGGTVSFGETESSKSKFTIGAVFNRYDPMLRYITRGDSKYIGDPKKNRPAVGVDNDTAVVDPNFLFANNLVGKTDLIAGFTTNGGLTIGLGGYMAFQSEKDKNVDKKKSQLVKGTLGVAGPVGDNVDLEASVNVGSISLIGVNKNNDSTVTSADGDMVVSADVRAFAGMSAINGSFVPHIQANVVKHHKDETLLDFNGGVGFNSNIDRGFLWGGLEGIYENDSYVNFRQYNASVLSVTDPVTGERSRIGGKVSFGIERNVLTDWLVWRVGGSKLLAFEKLNDGNVASYWVENSEDDVVSFGMGVNIEDRFKVDAVVAENLLYTFGNLFSGNSHHFSSKISATFSF